MAVQNLLLLRRGASPRRPVLRHLPQRRRADDRSRRARGHAVGRRCRHRASSADRPPERLADHPAAAGDHRGRPPQPLVTMVVVNGIAGPAGRLSGSRRSSSSGRPPVLDLRCALLRSPQRLRQLRWHRRSVTADVATDGEVRSFTIVTFAAPGVKVPFVSAIVDCDGTSVRGNLINVEPGPRPCHPGHEGAAGHVLAGHRRPRHGSHRVRIRARLDSGTERSSDERRRLDPGDPNDQVRQASRQGHGRPGVRGGARRARRRRRDDEGHGRARRRLPDAGKCRHRPAAAEADRPDRHPRLQRRQRLRDRRHRAAHGDHGGQGGGVRHGPGRRCREAGRRRPARRRRSRQERQRHMDTQRPLRRGCHDRWPDRH